MSENSRFSDHLENKANMSFNSHHTVPNPMQLRALELLRTIDRKRLPEHQRLYLEAIERQRDTGQLEDAQWHERITGFFHNIGALDVFSGTVEGEHPALRPNCTKKRMR
jgi:hypothetical protein